MTTDAPADFGAPLHKRLFTRRVGAMLVRNTVVSTGVFLVGLAVLYALVEYGGMDEVIASGIGQFVSTSIHYLFGRWWVFKGTTRAAGEGYAYFLVNAGIGIALTMALMWLFLEFTAINYLVARVLVSIVSGLVMFFLNAVLNFRRV